ncbi:MAG: phosphate signaling complex protein PhoU [Gammaproteobacteria bacterium]|nr:phosphate signaling complex protein PhoU [Gammaproteobacteria bacterium]
MELDTSDLGGHIHRQYDEDLEAIRTRVLAMGGLVEQQIDNALKALRDEDVELGERVVGDDCKINELEVGIDEECTRIIALRQPAAGDLRMVVAIIKTITDLERIGDEAEKIGRMAARLAGTCYSRRQMNGVQHLGSRVSKMVHDALDAFARLDVNSALRVVREDEGVDAEYETIMRTLSTYMMEDPRQIAQAMDIIWCVRALERIGDHAKNICEYLIYFVKGKDVRHISVEDMEREANALA